MIFSANSLQIEATPLESSVQLALEVPFVAARTLAAVLDAKTVNLHPASAF